MDPLLTEQDRKRIAELIPEFDQKYIPSRDGMPFALGDVCIENQILANGKLPFKNRLGANRKYKVVHVSERGVPFLKEITLDGKLTGPIRSFQRLEQRTSVTYFPPPKKREWEIDPDMVDAILLGQEYDPMAEARNRAALIHEIKAFNNANKVNTSSWAQIQTYLKKLRPNDSLWSSLNKEYVVIERAKCNKAGIPQSILVLDPEGDVKEFTVEYLLYKEFYKEKRRSINKEFTERFGDERIYRRAPYGDF